MTGRATPSEAPTREADPFEVLGLAPTRELAAVKRAWFAKLAQHPPHADPEGFRRIRAAYEALLRPGALEGADWARFDAAGVYAALHAALGPRLAAAARAHRDAVAAASALERFTTVLPWRGWAGTLAALEAASARGAQGGGATEG